MCRKRDLFARRCRFVVHDVEDAVGASREGRIDRLRDVVDVDAVGDVAGLGDAVHRAAPQPHHCVLSRTVDAAKPQNGDRQAPPRPECPPLKLRVDARASAASQRRTCFRGLVDPRAAAIAVDPEARQIHRGLKLRRPSDLVFQRREHGIAALRRRSRYEQGIGLRNCGSELARGRCTVERQHVSRQATEALLCERSRALRAARGSDDAVEALAEFADVIPGAVTQPETNKHSHQAAVAASAAVHSSATSGSRSRAR